MRTLPRPSPFPARRESPQQTRGGMRILTIPALDETAAARGFGSIDIDQAAVRPLETCTGSASSIISH